jgi:hypothetical protein
MMAKQTRPMMEFARIKLVLHWTHFLMAEFLISEQS